MSDPDLQRATVRNVAKVLRSTETMAARFVQRVQERIDDPISPKEILTVMEKIPAKRLSMDQVVARIERQRGKQN